MCGLVRQKGRHGASRGLRQEVVHPRPLFHPGAHAEHRLEHLGTNCKRYAGRHVLNTIDAIRKMVAIVCW